VGCNESEVRGGGGGGGADVESGGRTEGKEERWNEGRRLKVAIEKERIHVYEKWTDKDGRKEG